MFGNGAVAGGARGNRDRERTRRVAPSSEVEEVRSARAQESVEKEKRGPSTIDGDGLCLSNCEQGDHPRHASALVAGLCITSHS